MSSRLVAVFTPFENLADPRIDRTRIHDLFELIVVALCGTIAGPTIWADIERFGNDRLAWLRTFLRLEGGVPSHDTFGRVFALLDPAELVACIQQWLDDLGREIGKHIAIDGKTLRGSGDKAAGRNPLHLVSAWASETRLTLGQVAGSKSNEIIAIPLLLELLDLKGATVTIDAMGCQKEIAAKIVAGGGDYVLALKSNHEKLHAAVNETFTAALEADMRPPGMSRHVTTETNRGRHERREYTVLPAPRSLPGVADWPGLATLIMVLRLTQVDGREHGEVSYFLSSLPPSAVKTLANNPPALEHREPIALGARCNFFRRRQPNPKTTRPSDFGHVATPGSVHPLGGHFHQRYDPRKTLPSLPQYQHPGTHSPQFRRELRCDCRDGMA